MQYAALGLLVWVAWVGTPVAAQSQSPAGGAAASVYRSSAPAVFLLAMRDSRGDPQGIGSAFLID